MRKLLIAVGCVGVITILVLASSIVSSNDKTSMGRWIPSVIYRGFTNDGAGSKLGVFVITNASDSTCVRKSRYWLQVPSITRRSGKTIRSGSFLGSVATLKPGQFETVLVPVPTNGEAWRLYVFTRRDESVLKTVARDMITKPADRLGFRDFGDKFRNSECGIPSEWVEP